MRYGIQVLLKKGSRKSLDRKNRVCYTIRVRVSYGKFEKKKHLTQNRQYAMI